MTRWLRAAIMLAALLAPTLANAATSPGCTETIPELFERVSPSVVSISAVAVDPFDVNNRVSLVMGSGFIISADGLVLTNSHVVFGRQGITVTLDDGRKVEAKLLGADPITDLAVLRVPVSREGNPKALLGDSDSIRIGEEALAIGNPLGLEQTLTRGVVSGLNRFLPDSPLSLTPPLIQTDAPINPGNSGGPLFNRCGEVIGITTSMVSDAQNIGFAVPINIAKQVLPGLVEQGRVIRPWFGVSGRLISKEFMAIINLPMVDGFLVEKVDPGSPAEKAGIREGMLPVTVGGENFVLGGDIITEINRQSLNHPKKFAKLINSLKVGDTVQLTLYRENETRKVEFRLPERPILPGDLRPSLSGTLLPMGSRPGSLPLNQGRITTPSR
ncbi:MAG TPA: trypsin-like peptidase domain-containing protein [Syntrophobacteria bacterium]|nr:trypsin-like peptidase domain-containing protein [Syntrophobacteria bacterium]